MGIAIPRLLLLELLAVVLLTMDTWAVVVVAAVVFPFPYDAHLFLGVVVLPARWKAGGRSSRVGRDLTTFPPGPVVRGKADLNLLVGGRDRVLRLGVTVGGGEDAEGDGDSCFKIQVDCLVWARRVVFLSTLFSDSRSQKKAERKISLASSWGKKSKEKREEEKDPTNWMERTPSV